jgi:hypothetical protein
MTLLVSWAGVDTHGVASAYIAADSRISWGGAAAFDHCRKVYALRSSPDILGYCGDVLFPAIVLSQIVEMADRGLLFAYTATCKERFDSIKRKLVQQFHRYPRMVANITCGILEVLHISRGVDNKQFAGWLIRWQRQGDWSSNEVAFPAMSGVLFTLGTGSRDFNKNMVRYANGENRGTSRSVFHCFCDTLLNIGNKQCGGAPQLVGIYRKPGSPAVPYGMIMDKKRFFMGAQVEKDVSLESVEWRNDLFELCDGRTMKRLVGTQAQPDDMRRT